VPPLAAAASGARNGSGEVLVRVELARRVAAEAARGVADAAPLAAEVPGTSLPAGSAPATASLATGEPADKNGGTLPRWQSSPPAPAAPPVRGNGKHWFGK
jgi:hypothetical protein